MLFKKLIESETGYEVEKEIKFHPTRKWRLDYGIPSLKIAIEIEGGVWSGGRHTRGKGFIGDMEKYNAAACCGWVVIRFTPDDKMKLSTLETIKDLIRERELIHN